MIYHFGTSEFDFSSRTFVMGILNLTPDSFSDGGKYATVQNAVDRALQMVDEGADIIDVGGESTRPRGHAYGTGASPVSPEEEIRRVVPVVSALAARVGVPISVDTWKSSVAEEAIAAGAVIVNDISGFHFDRDLAGVVARGGASAILMHTPAPPWEMPSEVPYGNILNDVKAHFSDGITRAQEAGVSQILLDPGLGFGKNTAQNQLLLNSLFDLAFRREYPIVIGASRKSFLRGRQSLPVSERLEGSIAAAVVAALRGASIVRVHDVRQTVRALEVADAVLRSS